MDQEWNLSIQMTDRYTLGPLGEMASNWLASMWLGHKGCCIMERVKSTYQ